ncbi:MAG: hypothetical protein IJE60_08150 [Tyzzerella sp.]|nr:hypothetical protein [Tyzzerella sp.]
MISVSKVIGTNRSCNVCFAQNYVSPLCDKDRKQDIYELTVERTCIALCAKCLKTVGESINSFLKENKLDGKENGV